jgi:hypothetical protein
MEPYDECFTQRLRAENIYTHLISDHHKYQEKGGCGYHNQ